jgi:signal peptidase II
VREVQERRAVPTLIAVAAAVVAVDHLTKWLALRELAGRDIDLVATLRLHLVFNNGAAFGLGSKFAPLIALAAVGVVVVLLGVGRRLQGLVPAVAVAAIVGGAVGNLLDRLFRDGDGFLGGAVVDFIDLQWWPVFNVADIAVTLGALTVAMTVSRNPQEPS